MLDVGSIGSEPCQVSLNAILMNINDQHITNMAMSRYNKVRELLRKFELVEADDEFHTYLLQLMRTHQLRHTDDLKSKLPADVYTHLRCCIVGLFRSAERPRKESDHA